jgi:hypothetical protein
MTQTGMPATALFPQFVNVEDDSRYEGDEKRLDTAFPSFFRVPQVIWPFASSVELDRTKQPEVAADKMKIIARSTQYAIHETSDKVDLKPFRAWKPKGTWEQFGLAATVEGPLKSAFLTGDKQGVEAPEKSKAPARVLVISSSQYLANPLARAGAGQEMGGQMMGMPPQGGDEQLQQLAMPYAQLVLTTTILSFKNTLDWITGDTDLLAVSAKILAEPTLSYGQVEKPGMADDEEAAKKRDDEAKQIRHRTQIWIEIVLILGLPLLFVLYGLIRWQMRMSSRQKVSLA